MSQEKHLQGMYKVICANVSAT